MLAEMERFAENDPRLPALEALAREPLTDDQKTELHFALGKAYDDLGHYDAAFAQFEKGNALRRCSAPYDERAFANAFRDVEDAFTAKVLQDVSGAPSTVPVFVVGMPRSGTTLVERIIACDPSVLGAGELTHIQDLIGGGHAGDRYPRGVVDAAGFGKEYVRRLGKLPPGIRHVVDKFPGNFQHVGLIRLALPNAKIIHVRRNPMDTCFSCYSKLFLNGLNYSYDLVALGRYYRLYDALMAHWHSVLPQGAMLDIQYETLVGDLESEARRIVEFCGLEWNDRFLSFHENKGAVRTHSQAQIRRPLFKTAIGRWRNYEKHLGPLRAALGQT
jgi:hypothetical protein